MNLKEPFESLQRGAQYFQCLCMMCVYARGCIRLNTLAANSPRVSSPRPGWPRPTSRCVLEPWGVGNFTRLALTNASPDECVQMLTMAVCFCFCYPRGCAAPGEVQCQCNTRGSPSKLKRAPPRAKIRVTSKSPVGDISVVTLIRTDTTLDHSQKAEKVWQDFGITLMNRI